MFAVIKKALTFHWLVTLVLMGVFGLIFGLSSANLFHLLVANLRFIAEHGAMAVMEGALGQLFWLVFYGYLAVIAYVLLKACEHALMDRIFARHEATPEPELAAEPQTGAGARRDSLIAGTACLLHMRLAHSGPSASFAPAHKAFTGGLPML